MKAEATIRRRIRQLRRFIQDPKSDRLAVRVAQSVEDNLRWVLEDVVGWPNAVHDANISAKIIRDDQRVSGVRQE